MSWHTSALLIKADLSSNYLTILASLEFDATETEEIISFEEASSSSNDGIAIATIDGWTGLWSNLALLMVSDEHVVNLAKIGDIFQLVLEGASDTAGFTWYSKGKLVRDWLYQEGEILKNVGRPLVLEQQAFAVGDPEQAILQLLGNLTIPIDRLFEQQYKLFEIAEEY